MPRYWFKSKTYGWGWTPATREGWLAILAYVIIFALLAWNLTTIDLTNNDFYIQYLFPVFTLHVILIWIAYKTGEPPHWSWGKKR
jgi:Na+/proline symporter